MEDMDNFHKELLKENYNSKTVDKLVKIMPQIMKRSGVKFIKLATGTYV